MRRNRADCDLVSRWKRVMQWEHEKSNSFFSAGYRGIGMIEQRGRNGHSTGVGLSMLLDGGVRLS